MPRGLYVTFTNCTDPARNEEFNRWYSHTHLPDLSAVRGLVGARRFVNLQLDSGWSQYLALYEFDSDDLMDSTADFRGIGQESFAKGRFIDCLEGIAGQFYREIDPNEYPPPEHADYPARPSPVPANPGPSPAQTLAATLPRAVLTVMNNCKDPNRDDEFNRWYSHVHLPDLIPAQGLVKATRYRNEEPERGPSAYMAIYEFASDDLWSSRNDFTRLAGQTYAGRHIDCLEGIGGQFSQEIDASAYQPLEAHNYPQRL